MTKQEQLSAALAQQLLAVEWSHPELRAAARRALRLRAPWISELIAELLAAYWHKPADRPRELALTIRSSQHFQSGFSQAALIGRPLQIFEIRPGTTAMGRERWPVPEFDDLDQLASTLGLTPGQLSWLADLSQLQRRTPAGRLHPYDYRWITRAGKVARLLEEPTPILKGTQRRLLDEVLNLVPTHPAAHGFVRGRGALSNARQHVGERYLVTMDLKNFFGSISHRRIYGVFRSMGYPEPVAATLAGITTNRTPQWVLSAMPVGGDPNDRFLQAARLKDLHLPQGSPSSPALANLVAYTLDCRLTGFAHVLGASYSRYADDLTFSGDIDLRSRLGQLLRGVERIVNDEGFAINPRKTRVRGAGVRQEVTGIVVNERLNARRQDYERLRAILHDAQTRGPQAANREDVANFHDHLLGRIGWVAALNPHRGVRLRTEFAKIAWPDRG